MTTHIETRQECGHTALWGSQLHTPRIGQRIFCVRCEDLRKVESAPGAWHATCLQCTWKKTRMRVETLGKLVTVHVARTEHSVRVRNHDGTDDVKVYWRPLADSDGNHSASVSAMARVLPPSTPDQLF